MIRLKTRPRSWLAGFASLSIGVGVLALGGCNSNEAGTVKSGSRSKEDIQKRVTNPFSNEGDQPAPATAKAKAKDRDVPIKSIKSRVMQ